MRPVSAKCLFSEDELSNNSKAQDCRLRCLGIISIGEPDVNYIFE